MTLPVSHTRAVLERGGLYALTGVDLARGRSHRDLVEAFLDGGAELIQLRDKRADAQTYAEVARALHAVCEPRGVPFIVNDRPEVALAAGAEGVHLGQDDLDVAATRALAHARGRADLLIGVSTHAPAEAERGVAAGADYLGVGPIYPTLTKDYCVGIEYAHWAGEHLRLPWTLSGGVTEARLPEIAATGAQWIVVIQAINDTDDIAAATRRLREQWERARASHERAPARESHDPAPARSEAAR